MNLRKLSQLKKILNGIEVVRPPKYRLATFGESKIHYTLVTELPGFIDRARLRKGEVTAEKPHIITPQNMREKFFGFGSESDELFELLKSQYGDSLRGLQYQFHNELISTQVEITSPEHLIKELSGEFDQANSSRVALIRGTDKHWELSIMKFIVEETMASFASNINELQDRGFFHGEDRELDRQHREIQHLLNKARNEKSLVQTVGKKLKEYGLFEHYQDQFFRLLK